MNILLISFIHLSFFTFFSLLLFFSFSFFFCMSHANRLSVLTNIYFLLKRLKKKTVFCSKTKIMQIFGNSNSFIFNFDLFSLSCHKSFNSPVIYMVLILHVSAEQSAHLRDLGYLTLSRQFLWY